MMEQIFVSINGDDSKNGLTRAEAINSWKRLMQLSRGNAEWVLMEGDSTQAMLLREELERRVIKDANVHSCRQEPLKAR